MRKWLQTRLHVDAVALFVFVFSPSPRLSVRMFGSGGKKRASLRGGGTAVRNPKLSAVAIASLTGNDFAMRLDRAIMRSGKLIEAKAIELPQAE